MVKYLKYLVFKLVLFVRGIRFFKTDIIPSNAEFRKAEFKTLNDHTVEFLFYREVFQDIIFRRGRIHKENFHCYIIQSKFDNDLPPDIKQFNNLKFVFNLNSVFLIEEEKVCEVLLGVYLDFIKREIILQKK
jgi:hypothetical protein